MNDLGLTLAWSAVRVSLVLLPAAALHALASRRGAASGAWVAALSLGLVVAFSLLTLAPGGRAAGPTAAPVAAPGPAATPDRGGPAAGETGSDGEGPVRWIVGLRAVRERFETTATVPADRCRRWGGALAAVFLTGAGGGLLRLVIGLWAVRACRRRSRPVNDPDLIGLLEELRGTLGCRRGVEVRETRELTTPATAGVRRPVVLLPGDWRSWDGHERRAVLAHELAHICREDYLTGVVARVALALHFYHPLVHHLAARLRLEQELAADAVGARLSGGKAVYLRSLSRLALRQDGRPPCGPVRAFLPGKGILIRRIAMLRDETKSPDRPWSAPRKALSALVLLAVSAGALSLRGPARGDGIGARNDGAETVTPAPRPDDKGGAEPFDLSYLPEGSQGMVAVRPSALFRRSGMGVYRTLLNLWIGQQWSKAANAIGFDPAKPGQGPLRVEMFEQVTTIFRFERTGGKKPNGRLMVGDVISARTTEPVDWVGLLRAFRQELTEAREGGRVYYKIKNPALGPDGCVFCPDDRTVVYAGGKQMRALLRRKTPPPAPAFAGQKDGDRLRRGLLLVAFDNRGGQLAKVLKSGGPEIDPEAALLEHAELWTFGFDNEDGIAFRAVAACPDDAAGEATARAAETLLGVALKESGSPGPAGAPHRQLEENGRRMSLEFLRGVRVVREGRSVLVRSAGLGKIADFAALVAASSVR